MSIFIWKTPEKLSYDIKKWTETNIYTLYKKMIKLMEDQSWNQQTIRCFHIVSISLSN